MQNFFSVFIGYLLGSIPFALLIGKVFYGIDIRNHGSGNLGGTNAGRTLGAKAGIIVALLDILKASIAMSLAFLFFDNSTNSYTYLLLAGFFASIGHCFPLFANFKGGKAVSTAIGFLFGINLFITHDYFFLFMIPVLIFFIALYISKMVSLSAMISLISATILLIIRTDDYLIPFFFAIITLIVILRHRENIKRILNGNERKIKWM